MHSVLPWQSSCVVKLETAGLVKQILVAEQMKFPIPTYFRVYAWIMAADVEPAFFY